MLHITYGTHFFFANGAPFLTVIIVSKTTIIHNKSLASKNWRGPEVVFSYTSPGWFCYLFRVWPRNKSFQTCIHAYYVPNNGVLFTNRKLKEIAIWKN